MLRVVVGRGQGACPLLGSPSGGVAPDARTVDRSNGP